MRIHRNSEQIGSDVAPFCVFGGLFPALHTHASRGSLNSSLSGHRQVAQSKQCSQLSGVLGQPFVAFQSALLYRLPNNLGCSRVPYDKKVVKLCSAVAVKRFCVWMRSSSHCPLANKDSDQILLGK
jgi:hypothetical protein